MPDFSILVPTRQRLGQLKRLLTSLVNTIHDYSTVEILLAIDNDDNMTKLGLPQFMSEFNVLNIQVHYRERSEFTNRDYINWLIQWAKGKYLWACADDLVFTVEKWNVIIKEKMEKYLSLRPDRILLAGVSDDTPPPKRELPNFACFPLITREAYNFFGYLVPPQLPTWGADYLLYLVYSNGKRYLPIEDRIYINHIAWHNPKLAISPDPIAKRIQQIFGRMQHIPQHNVDRQAASWVPVEVRKLFDYLKSKGYPLK